MLKMKYTKKISLFVCVLVLATSFMGFRKKIIMDNGNLRELVSVSDVSIKEVGNRTEVSGSATNNNPRTCSMHLKVIYTDSNGTIVKTQPIQLCDVKAGETKYYCNVMWDTDISNTSHKIRFVRFFTYK